MDNKRIRVTIISFPVGRAFAAPLSNLVSVFCGFCGGVNVIAGCGEEVAIDVKGDSARIFRIFHPGGIARFFITQARLALSMLRLSRETDLFVFFGQGPPLLNVLTARATGKRIMWALPSSLVRTSRAQKHTMSLILAYLLPPCYLLSDRLVVYSDRLVGEWDLTKYRKKISIAHEHYIDTGRFRATRKHGDRDNIVGYIGRLSPEKGVPALLSAIPAVLKDRPDARFLFIGDGPLRGRLRQFIADNGLGGRVEAVDWVSHDDLPRYFNELKLLVLPSCTEGLPNVILEAMACGTPVLTTPVGAIPDVVIDSVTGFIISDSSPEKIAKNILRALDYPWTGDIIDNARSLIDKDYAYTAAVMGYKRVAEAMVNKPGL